MIFIHICKKADKYLAKIVFKEGEKWKWSTTTEAVYNWAKKNFKEDDVVDVEYEIKNSQYFVSRISAPGQGSKKSATKEEAPKESSKPTCADCGKELSDSKYEKCYTCNQKSPSPKTRNRYAKTPEEQEAIARQNANHATSRALIALQGQVDVNSIFEIAKRLHEMFLSLARGK